MTDLTEVVAREKLETFVQAMCALPDMVMNDVEDYAEAIRATEREKVRALECANTDTGGLGHLGEVIEGTYTLFGLRVRIAFCGECGGWFNKWYDASREASNRGK